MNHLNNSEYKNLPSLIDITQSPYNMVNFIFSNKDNVKFLITLNH